MSVERELGTPQVRANPYPFYARLREMAPVIPVTKSFGPTTLLMDGKGFFLTRYEDIYDVFKDPRFVNDRANAVEGGAGMLDHWWIPRIFKMFQKSMAAQDEPDHRRLRDLVHQAFTPRMIDDLTARMEQLVGEMLDRAEEKPTTDLIADLALPLPLTIISEMLGVPPKERMLFRQMMVRLTESLASGPAGFLLNFPTTLRLERFLRRLVKLRREQPADDLITALVQAEAAGDRLNEDELIGTIFLLLIAGHETTVNLIGNGALALLENPDQLHRLREHPELIGSAIEELLRFTNPVEQLTRFAREDVEIQGYKIPRGSLVILLLASANRDEAAFENADTLDITRNPNRHLSLGYGLHYCLGAPLARLEGRIALLNLVQRFPEMGLAVPQEKLRWRKNVSLHGLLSLPLHLGRRGAVAA